MTTKTQTLEDWLTQCPNKLEFYSRFIDVKEDVLDNIKDYELAGEGNIQRWTEDDIKDITYSVINDTNWSNYNDTITQLIKRAK